ncbi:kelch-like protein 40 [Drosophila albomicans]|uniref:Kelch-like protein 40 n=1 Tax=Drosophila albomicans TaxID=7291 RepID=A0A6P8Y2G0_DROAB|nr:kelch-like protein 40 [Drosophila albomicans]
MYCKLRRLDLLRKGQLSDCELHVAYVDSCKKSCSRQFRCHKQMLASASTEFERLINDPEFERNQRVILVEDASPDAYEALLLYIYTYEIYSAITVEMCCELIHLATKYNIPDFIDSYITKLADQNWPIGTVLKIFQLANEFNRPSIMELVGKKIAPVATQLLNDNSFLRLSLPQLKALMLILKSLGSIPDKQLLCALKKYQKCNNLHYSNMACFQEFVGVVNIFGQMLFEADGTLSLVDKEAPPFEEVTDGVRAPPPSTVASQSASVFNAEVTAELEDENAEQKSP